MNDAIQKLVDAVQKASPVVWQAAYRQAYLSGFEWLLLLIVLIAITTILTKMGLFYHRRDESDDGIGVVLCSIGAGISLIVSTFIVATVLDCFVNPTFQAIREIKGLL
jgi:hypothetical protein